MQTCTRIESNGELLDTKGLTKDRDSSLARCKGGGTERFHHQQHFCLFGLLHLTNGMKFLVSVGLVLTVVLCILEAIWFRRALCVMIVPLSISLISTCPMDFQVWLFCQLLPFSGINPLSFGQS
ncbi:unnamed protein product [Meloidogyne enterolobii]|uniref:Uncharacterized protein n=1 Tax=Meloidogyne enterolobii TaxID=390850 RepID=A0ACB1AYL4_MELEN